MRLLTLATGLKIDDMTLDFDGFSVAALFASIIIVTYVVQEGKSNWYNLCSASAIYANIR